MTWHPFHFPPHCPSLLGDRVLTPCRANTPVLCSFLFTTSYMLVCTSQLECRGENVAHWCFLLCSELLMSFSRNSLKKKKKWIQLIINNFFLLHWRFNCQMMDCPLFWWMTSFLVFFFFILCSSSCMHPSPSQSISPCSKHSEKKKKENVCVLERQDTQQREGKCSVCVGDLTVMAPTVVKGAMC